MSPLIRTFIPLDQGPTHMTSFNLITSLQTPPPNTVALGIGASIYELGGGDTIQSITGMLTQRGHVTNGGFRPSRAPLTSSPRAMGAPP